MKQKGSVSVIIPVYNAESFISQTIDRVLAQDFAHFELILVNDGSSDRSQEIISRYETQDSRIQAVHQTNSGPSAARNTGLDKARGEFVLFIDADDYLTENALKDMIEAIKEAQMLVFGYHNAFADAPEKIKVNAPAFASVLDKTAFLHYFGELFESNLIHYVWNKLYRRNSLIGLTFDEQVKVGEDLLFNLDVFNRIESVAVSRGAFYVHNWDNSDSITAQYHADLFSYRQQQLQQITAFLNNNEAMSCKNRAIIERAYFRKYLACMFSLESPEARLSKQEKKAALLTIAEAAEQDQLLSYEGKAGWEKLVVFLMRQRSGFLLCQANRLLKSMQDIKRSDT